MTNETADMDDRLKGIIEQHDSDVKNLIPILQSVQEAYSYLPAAAISAISDRLHISEDVIFGVATFYTHFKFTKPGEHIIKICLGTACFVKGAENLLEILKDRLQIEPGQTTPDNSISLERVACLGCCALAPTIVLDNEVYGKMSSLKLSKIIDDLLEEKGKKEEEPRIEKNSDLEKPEEKTRGVEGSKGQVPSGTTEGKT